MGLTERIISESTRQVLSVAVRTLPGSGNCGYSGQDGVAREPGPIEELGHLVQLTGWPPETIFRYVALSQPENFFRVTTQLRKRYISLKKKKKTCYFWLLWVFIAAKTLCPCGEQGPLFAAVLGLLIAVASLVAEHRL